ncbi:hypothetical protein FSP39_022119 [Pinctada imbricata]|uniref:Chitin-binding type-2 domain-containing protein n=1 Tax=Pinctada imbricata TaxID=66713 RepID=A0AA88XPC8_PINIB|nr:hypothetical protein FSP39_022119 [Pinctada imbricata]
MKHSSLVLLIATFVLCVSVDAVVRRSGCVLQKVLGHPNRFTVHKSLLPGENRNRKFYCSNGTVFDEDLCTCVRNQDPYFQATAPPITQSPYATDSSVSPLMSTERPCVFAPALDKRYYMQRRSFGSGWFRRPCPYGLLFNETLCLCTDPAPIAISCKYQLNVYVTQSNKGGEPQQHQVATPTENPKTPNAKLQSRHAQNETQKGQGTSTHNTETSNTKDYT